MLLFKNTKTFIISTSILCVIFFGAVGLLCSSTKLKWNITETQSYQFKVKTESRSDSPKMSLPVASIMEIEGTLNYKYFEEKDNLIRIGFQLSPVKYSADGIENHNLSDFYSQPFIVEFTKDGDILKIYTENIFPEDYKLIEMLISQMKLVSKTAFWGKWSTIESDSSGLYSSSYSKFFSKTKKKRNKYIIYNNYDNKRNQIIFTSSENVFKTNSKCSWIHSFYSKEKIFFSNMEYNVRSVITCEIDFLSANLSETCTLSNFNNFDSAFKSLSENRKNNLPIQDKIRIDATKENLKKESIRSLVSKFISQTINQSDFERQLADLLIINPDEAYKIYDMIVSKSFSPNVLNSLLVAASLASTDQSQKVLINVSSNPGINFNHRLQASVYLGDLIRINMDSVRLIDSYSQNFSNQNTAILSSAMLCSAARIYGRHSKDYPSEEVDEINRMLNQKLNIAKSTIDTCAVIRAIGNTEEPSFYEKLNDYRKNSNDAFIRAAALESLTKIDSKQASDAIMDSFKNDKDARVISEAVRIQSAREESPEFSKEIASRIVKENDLEIKNSMIEYFMNNGKNDPKIKEALMETLKTETDPNLRIKLHKAIYSKITKPK